jgi:hypothetical protein
VLKSIWIRTYLPSCMCKAHWRLCLNTDATCSCYERWTDWFIVLLCPSQLIMQLLRKVNWLVQSSVLPLAADNAAVVTSHWYRILFMWRSVHTLQTSRRWLVWPCFYGLVNVQVTFSLLDLWWTKWHWHGFVLRILRFYLSSFHQCSALILHSFTNDVTESC